MAWQHDQIDWITKSGLFGADQQATLLGLGSNPTAIGEIERNAGTMGRGSFHGDFIAGAQKYLVDHPAQTSWFSSLFSRGSIQDRIDAAEQKLKLSTAKKDYHMNRATMRHNTSWFGNPILKATPGATPVTPAAPAAAAKWFGWKSKLFGGILAAGAIALGANYEWNQWNTPTAATMASNSPEAKLEQARQSFAQDHFKELREKGSTSFKDKDVNFTINNKDGVYSLSYSYTDASGTLRTGILVDGAKDLGKFMGQVSTLAVKHEGFLAAFAKGDPKYQQNLDLFKKQIAAADQTQATNMASDDSRNRAPLNGRLTTPLPAEASPKPTNIASAAPPTSRFGRPTPATVDIG